MKLNMKRVGICFLFCLIFIVMGSMQVYAEEFDLWVSNNGRYSDGESVELFKDASFDNSDAVTGGSIYSTQTIGRNISMFYLNWFRELVESDWATTELPKFDITYYPISIIMGDNPDTTQREDYYIEGGGRDTEHISYNLIDGADGALATIIENSSNGAYYTTTNGSSLTLMDRNIEMIVELEIGENTYRFHILPEGSYKINTSTKQKLSITNKHNYNEGSSVKNQYYSSDNAYKLFSYFQNCALKGIVAGSVEAGYNIGIPYSANQRPLPDVMELQGSGYEFKNGSTVNFTFGYFYSPLFGNMYLNKETYLPTSARAEEMNPDFTKEDLWMTLIKQKHGAIFKNGKIVIPETFIQFVHDLSDTYVNESGYKLTTVNIENGATRFNLDTAKNPQNVMSYNVPLAVPYMFTVTTDVARLSTSNLKLIEGYVYCLYNDCIYKDSDMTLVTSMEYGVGTPRKNIYLYHQTLPGEEMNSSFETGVALIGVFDECVVDYNVEIEPDDNEVMDSLDSGRLDEYLKNIYLTGRKIAFDNGYSDALNIREKNVNLLYTNSEAGKKAYLPLNILFPMEVEDTNLSILWDVLSADMVESYPDLDDVLKKRLSYNRGAEFFDDLWDKGQDDGIGVHGEIPTTIRIVKLYIDFGQIINQDREGEKGASKYAFYCVRNNAYLNDSDLEDWLKSETARSLTYVNADTLLSKIKGDFRVGFDRLSYPDWKRMQEIKDYLQNEKDMWIVRVMNVMSILMGVGLIVFAILFMMAYWIDIFNTFSKASILQMISFGNMYPVAEKDTIEMLPDRGGKIKYVTFKDVLILGLIMVAVGILFLNVSTLVSWITSIYGYIMYVLGGAI